MTFDMKPFCSNIRVGHKRPKESAICLYSLPPQPEEVDCCVTYLVCNALTSCLGCKTTCVADCFTALSAAKSGATALDSSIVKP